MGWTLAILGAISLYLLASYFTIKRLFKTCADITNPNLNLLARSFYVALFLTSTISVPASVPVPASLQMLLGFAGFHFQLILVGLVPILIGTMTLFIVLKLINVLKTYGETH